MRNSEYLVDRLRSDIMRLEREIAELHRERGEAIIAEAILAMICLFIGFCVGAWII